MGILDVVEGQKFAILSMPVGWIDPAMPDEVDLGEVRVLRSLEVPVSGFWKDALGSLRLGEFGEADVHVVTKDRTESPKNLDEENQALLDRTWRFYHGLLMAVDNFSHGRIVRVTGADEGGGPNIRQVQAGDETHFILGCQKSDLGAAELAVASEISRAFERLVGVKEYSRFWRITYAFYDAVRSTEAGYRIHQFVRCIEGLILPERGKTERQFASRTELLVGPGHHALMKQLFKIRSSVEHLHGPLADVSRPDERERRLALMEYSVRAEAIARYSLRRLLTTASIQEHFEKDSCIRDFWAMSSDERKEVWGAPMDPGVIPFESSWVSDEDLGLG